MKRRGPGALLSVSLLSVTLASRASADEAAPLPAKDVRWSATLGGGADVGSLPRASTGLALGFDVRRGALAARGLTSFFAPVMESATGASVALLDVMAMVCALAPVSAWLDAGACGGGGAGLLRAERSGAELLHGMVVGVAETSCHSREELARDAGNFVDDATELALAEHHEFHVGLRGHRGVTRCLVEEGELAECGARAEGRDLPAASGDLGRALEDHDELRSARSLADEHSTRRDLHVLGSTGDQPELLPRECGEQGHLGKVADEDVVASHRRNLGATWR